MNEPHQNRMTTRWRRLGRLGLVGTIIVVSMLLGQQVGNSTAVAALDSQGLDAVGLTLDLDLPEMGASGTAIITDLRFYPTVQTGTGQVVTATFSHPPSQQVLEVQFEGESSPLGVTDNHRFWSVDRHEFLPIGQMQLGERVQTFQGDTKRIVQKLPRPGPQVVYNLEVYGEHVYFVGEQGLLAHNMYGSRTANNAGTTSALSRATTRAQWKALNRADRIARRGQSWNTTRRQYWKQLGNAELANPTGAFSETNVSRLLEGLAPRITAQLQLRSGRVVTRNISVELHHRSLPQRTGSPTANEFWNLEPTYPWAHEAMDQYRHTGYDLLRIIRGTNSF